MTKCFFRLVAVGAMAWLATASGAFAQGQPRIDGKPNFTGLWGPAPGGGGGGGGQAREASQFQGGAAERRLTRREQGLKDIPLAEWGREAFLYYTAGDGAWQGETGFAGDPRYHTGTCGGPKAPSDIGNSFLFYQTPEMLMITGQTDQPWIRKIWIGGQHPADLTDYVPFWMGHSVGRWEGDTLVVDTVRIKEGTLISQARAIPQSGNLRMTERISMVDGRVQIQRTFADPVAFSKPWSDTLNLARQTDWEDMKFGWEIQESHAVCDPKGGYSREHDPWFDNFDKLKKEFLPDAERLDKGPPPVPEEFRQQ
jgi:hypothetical protein